MMQKLLIFLSVFFYGLSILLPYHGVPWVTFESELFAFITLFFLLSLCLYQNNKIPKLNLFILCVAFIPLVQFLCGQVIYLSNAILSSSYILILFFSIFVGFNLSQNQEYKNFVFKFMAYSLFVIGLVSASFVILQWLGLSHYLSLYIVNVTGNRPYANMSQPNNLAIFMIISLFSTLYLKDKKILSLSVIIPSIMLILSAIALTQSRAAWVVFIFILIYVSLKKDVKDIGLIRKDIYLFSFIFFIFVLCLPSIGVFLKEILHFNILAISSAGERVSSGHLRLDLWQQAYYAIIDQPWFGFGWNQSSLAQITIFNLYPNHEWIRSFHNIVFDVLVWNGLPIGIAILVYAIYLLYRLEKNCLSLESILAMMMIFAVVIHSVFEFPLHYLYFIVPFGFLIGFIQSQDASLNAINFNTHILKFFVLISFLLSIFIVRDYYLLKSKVNALSNYSEKGIYEQNVLNKNIYILTQFNEWLWWVTLDDNAVLDDEGINIARKLVYNSASVFNLTKYVRILVNSNKLDEANKILNILNGLYSKQFKIDDFKK
ncbi:MAG: Wzy polymerase domain-containing protein [Acinetobacter sp.]